MQLSVEEAGQILTPALLLDVDALEKNLDVTLGRMGGNPGRWRPHVKTAKILSAMQHMVARGIFNFKCATTLELVTVCQAGAQDVLVAFPCMPAQARRIREIAAQYPQVGISVLIEDESQLEPLDHGPVGAFVDINPGMNRTGMDQSAAAGLLRLVNAMQTRGIRFRGLHYYDGQHHQTDLNERRAAAFAGYGQLLKLVEELAEHGHPPPEVITSGTPALPCALEYPGFQDASFVHRVSAGTVVYNDLTSLGQFPAEWGYQPAVMVLATVVSHPAPDRITCDAGHKSVSADAGVPTCAAWNCRALEPLNPSEEHLPLRVPPGTETPPLGALLYLVPKHVCPTVNNFDHVVIVRGGAIAGMERVTARGREAPLR
jgi:D-serine deaminase-like pyridoxal phosphate-dependent protein